MSGLFVALVVVAAFLLGLRTGIAIGYRAQRRCEGDKRDLPRTRA